MVQVGFAEAERQREQGGPCTDLCVCLRLFGRVLMARAGCLFRIGCQKNLAKIREYLLLQRSWLAKRARNNRRGAGLFSVLQQIREAPLAIFPLLVLLSLLVVSNLESSRAVPDYFVPTPENCQFCSNSESGLFQISLSLKWVTEVDLNPKIRSRMSFRPFFSVPYLWRF